MITKNCQAGLADSEYTLWERYENRSGRYGGRSGNRKRNDHRNGKHDKRNDNGNKIDTESDLDDDIRYKGDTRYMDDTSNRHDYRKNWDRSSFSMHNFNGHTGSKGRGGEIRVSEKNLHLLLVQLVVRNTAVQSQHPRSANTPVHFLYIHYVFIVDVEADRGRC